MRINSNKKLKQQTVGLTDNDKTVDLLVGKAMKGRKEEIVSVYLKSTHLKKKILFEILRGNEKDLL